MLNRLVKLIPIISALILFSGALNLIMYYAFFKVNITDYIKGDEILTLFLNDLVKFSLIIAITIIPFVYRSINNQQKFKFILPVFVALILTFVLCFLDTDSSDNKKILYGILILSFLCLFYLMLYLSDKFIDTNKEINDIYKYFLILVILLNLYNIIINFYTVINICNNDTYRNTKIEFEDKSILQSTDEYFIGKTNDYIFMYNQQKKETIIYPIKQIKNIKILR